MSSATSAVAVVLYRAMWRWTRSEAVRLAKFAVPLESLPSEVLAVAERLQPTEVLQSTHVDQSPGKMTGVLRDQAGVQALVRAAWREGALVDEAEAGARLDGAFKCLRAMDGLQAELQSLIDLRVARASRCGISHVVGEVVRHRKFGFRGVVVGWDPTPQVDVSGWEGVRGLPSGGEQPFYKILPDQTDCAELLGGPRDMKYVAQENLEARNHMMNDDDVHLMLA